MTQEEKELLLKDICTRLPYGIYIYHEDYCEDNPEKLDTIYCDTQLGDYGFQCCVDDTDEGYHNIEQIKPYLRPMSSMTKEEEHDFRKKCFNNTRWYPEKSKIWHPKSLSGLNMPFDFMAIILDWLNAHHFDYRDLIEKGLAMKAPEGIYGEIVNSSAD